MLVRIVGVLMIMVLGLMGVGLVYYASSTKEAVIAVLYVILVQGLVMYTMVRILRRS